MVLAHGRVVDEPGDCAEAALGHGREFLDRGMVGLIDGRKIKVFGMFGRKLARFFGFMARERGHARAALEAGAHDCEP
jgi:hypothetical protein